MKRDKLLQRWSGVYLSALFLLLPLWLHRGYFDITETKTVLFAALTLLYLAGVLFGLLAGGSGGRRPGRGALLFALFAALNILSSLLFGGRDALLAANNRYQGVGMWLLYAAMVCALSAGGKFGKWQARTALGAFALVSLLCVLNALYIDPLGTAVGLRSADRSRYLSTIGNVNFIGAYVSLLLPLAMGLFCLGRSRRELWLRGGVCLLGAGALLVGSDCGILGVLSAAVLLPWLLRREPRALRRLPWLLLLFAAALPLFGRLLERGIGLSALGRLLSSLPVAAGLALLGGALLLFARRQTDEALSALAGNYPVLPAALLLGGGVFLLLGNTLLRDRLPASIARWTVFSGSWGSDRGAIWGHCLALYGSFGPLRKLIGGGAGCLARYDALHRLFPDAIIDSAHNEYLHYLLTSGALGLGAWLGALAAALRRVLSPEGADAALLCAVAGCAVQGVVNIAQCTTTPLFFALLALLWGSRGSGEDS